MFSGSRIIPCGLIAWSLFNDTYSFSLNNQNLSVNKKGISWKSDRDHKFGSDVFPKNFPNNFRNSSALNGTSFLIGGATLNESIPVSLHLNSCFGWINHRCGCIYLQDFTLDSKLFLYACCKYKLLAFFHMSVCVQSLHVYIFCYFIRMVITGSVIMYKHILHFGDIFYSCFTMMVVPNHLLIWRKKMT